MPLHASGQLLLAPRGGCGHIPICIMGWHAHTMSHICRVMMYVHWNFDPWWGRGVRTSYANHDNEKAISRAYALEGDGTHHMPSTGGGMLGGFKALYYCYSHSIVIVVIIQS